MFAEPRPRAPDLADLDLHRIDLAARLLALGHAELTTEALISAGAAACGADVMAGEAVGVGLFIAEMARHAGAPRDVLDSDREMLAAERFAELLAALVEPGDINLLRGLRRSGVHDRPLPLPAQRRIRRACLRLQRAPANSATLEPLPTELWDELLAGLARSLAFDRESELWTDVASDGLGETALDRVRAQVREAIARAARSPVPWSVSIVASHTEPGPTGGAWTPRERELLPAGHRVGRFTLLQRLGVGAMGVVYSAVDPELDRRIAVKLLRAPAGPRAARAQARLLREAQAMARVTHPNVAVVHEVGTHDGDVFVAMELVRGVTLQAWLRHKPRTWREVVEVFMQAARGLAAAHAAGLVHRDFKPSNAMMGDDGRVRVLDFGLCFTGGPGELADGEAARREDGSESVDLRITQREEIVGTPAYMPPEQFLRGGVAGPASDQFSFCASLYEGLYAQLPFAGQTVTEVTQAIALGQLRPPPRGTKVPGWLFAVIQRGLKPAPDDRFPTMDAMMRALDRGRARARGSLALAATLALGTGVGGFWAARTQGSASDPCSGGAARIAEVWSPTHEAAAARAMAAAGPAFASEIWPRVRDELGRYADSWQLAHREACQAHRRGETSDTLLDRRMACLEQRRAALGAAAHVLAEQGPEVALHALEVVSNLPGLARCDDLELLAAEAVPPSDPAVLAAIAGLRPQLARVQTLEHAGLPHAAVRLADELVTTAETIPDRGVLAETLLTRGRLEINRLDRPSDQEEVLGRAFLTAFGGRLDELATEALALRMYTRGRVEGRVALALDDLALAREMLARLPAAGRVRGLVFNNAGTVYLASGDQAQATAMFRAALAEREATLGPHHLEVAFTLVNLALVSAADERVPLLRRGLEILDRQLGEAHPQTLEVRLAASMLLPDPDAARASIAPGCAALARFAPGDRTRRARCEAVLANHAAEAGDRRTAASAFIAADELLAAADPRALTMLASEVAEIRGRAALYTGKHTEAITLLRAQLAAEPSSEAWWQRLRRAELLLLLGLHLDHTREHDAAGEALSAALADFERASTEAPDMLQQQRLASARAAVAAHLLNTHNVANRSRAAALIDAAERWYQDAGPGYAWRQGELAALRRRAAGAQ